MQRGYWLGLQVASAILKQNLMNIRRNEFKQGVEITLFEYYLKENFRMENY